MDFQSQRVHVPYAFRKGQDLGQRNVYKGLGKFLVDPCVGFLVDGLVTHKMENP